MDWLDPMRDLLQPEQAKRLSARLPSVSLRMERIEPARLNAYFPAPKCAGEIFSGGQVVGRMDYAISLLGDRLYINKIDIHPEFKRRGYALAVLWQLHLANGLPIVPVSVMSTSEAHAFWISARRWFKAAGAVIERDMRLADLREEQKRWAHLIPEPEHLAQQRAVEASPEWPSIKAAWAAREHS